MGCSDVCKKIVDDVSDALACGVVDLNTGMLMGVHHTIPYFTQAYLDAVAGAAVDMFRGKNVRRIEELLSKQRGSTLSDSIQELFFTSPQTYHFMSIVPGKQAVCVLITKKSTNQGLGWATLRGALSGIAGTLP